MAPKPCLTTTLGSYGHLISNITNIKYTIQQLTESSENLEFSKNDAFLLLSSSSWYRAGHMISYINELTISIQHTTILGFLENHRFLSKHGAWNEQQNDHFFSNLAPKTKFFNHIHKIHRCDANYNYLAGYLQKKGV